MSPNSWADGAADGSSQPSHQLSNEQQPTAKDMQMAAHLMSKFSPQELSRLFQKVQMAIPDDRASIISTATYQSSNLSDDASSIFDTESVRNLSDTSSISGASIFSSVSSKLLGRKSGNSAQVAAAVQAQVQAQQAASWNDHDGASSTTMVEPAGPPPQTPTAAAPKIKASFKCGFCEEEGITKTCTRKNDLKRHIEDFHNMNAQWFCRQRGCQLVFDWQTAYKTHLKAAHGGSRMSIDEAKVNLCPQVVFACGFENCPQVFEANTDADAGHTFKEYVSHVVKHFDEGAQSGEWSYSTRMRNLLRQSQVITSWTECGWGDQSKASLTWTPQTSGILRKRLECRHIGDVKLLIHYALQLGSNPSAPIKFREDFIVPVLDTCTVSGQGHVAKKAPAPMMAQEPESFNFRISRGTNPQLAQHYNAQRRLYVPPRHATTRRPHGHQRPPMPTSIPTSSPVGGPMNNHHGHGHTSSHGTMQTYFTSLPEAAQSAPSLYETSQSYSPSTTMMTSAGGIIADDLRSFRNLANSGTPEPDVDMTDSPSLMGPDFSAQYTTQPMGSPVPDGLSSPMPDGLSSPVAMNHNAGFYHTDQQIAHHPHAY